jgi:hypothetical protein
MAAPMGTWNFFTSNASPVQLVLATGSGGGITGSLNGVPLTAVWDDDSQILSMAVATAGGAGADYAGFSINVYTGTLFQPFATPNGLVAGDGVPLMLAGNWGTGTAGKAVGPFNQSGWFATNTTKFKEKEGKDGKDTKEKDKDTKEKDTQEGKHGVKDPKDLKDKDQIKEKDGEPEIKRRGAAPDDVMAAAIQAEESGLSEVRIATGRSFIPEEERPPVGSAALRN